MNGLQTRDISAQSFQQQRNPNGTALNGAFILGDNFRDFKRDLEVGKMNSFSNTQNQPNFNDTFSQQQQQIKPTISDKPRTPFTYTPIRQLSQNSSSTTLSTPPYTKIVQSNQQQQQHLQQQQHYQQQQQPSYPNNTIQSYSNIPTPPTVTLQQFNELSHEIHELKMVLTKSLQTQNEMQNKIIEYNKLIAEQEKVIRMSNYKLNEHDSKLTEILLSFNNYLQINEKSSTTINEVQKKLDNCINKTELTDLRSTVYTLNKNNETNINELSNSITTLNLKINEFSQENETYQKFTLEKIQNVQKDAMESRLEQQNELIKLEESKEARLTAQFNQLRNNIGLVEKNLQEETEFRKKMIDTLREEVLESFQRHEEKFKKAEKIMLETENNIITVNKDFMTTVNELISKNNEKYEMELRAIRSIIEAGLTKANMKLENEIKTNEQNLIQVKSDMFEQKTQITEIDNFIKDTIQNMEKKFENAKQTNQDYFTKFDLLSNTLDKYMKENLSLINAKCEELTNAYKKEIADGLGELRDVVQGNKEETGKQYEDLKERIGDVKALA
jgi:hypothetical protein